MKKLLFVLPFLLFACKTSINPKNQSFYCKINGQEFIPEKDNSPIGGVGSSPLKISRDTQNGWFSIYSWNTPIFIGLTLKVPTNATLEIKDYILGSDLKESKAYFTNNSTLPVSDYLISSSGKITITKIEGTKFWGTFEFKTKDTKTNQEYVVSEGQLNNLSF